MSKDVKIMDAISNYDIHELMNLGISKSTAVSLCTLEAEIQYSLTLLRISLQ